MERVIKLRGKKMGTNKWVYGDLSVAGGKSFISTYPRVRPTEVEPSTIGQLESICPRTGEEIYEGDIVHYDHEDGIVRAKVVYKKAEDESDGHWMSGFTHEVITIDKYPDSNDEAVEYEVIGNIHDNPELLITDKAELEVLKSTVEFNLAIDFKSFCKMLNVLKDGAPELYEGFRTELNGVLAKLESEKKDYERDKN